MALVREPRRAILNLWVEFQEVTVGRIVTVLTVVLAVTACEQTAKGIEQDVRNSGQVIDIMLN